MVPVPDEDSGNANTDPFFANYKNGFASSKGLDASGFNGNGVGSGPGSLGTVGGGKRTRGKVAVADLIRTEVLGAFVHNAIEWVHMAEQQSQQGLISDDRAVKGVQSVSSWLFISGARTMSDCFLFLFSLRQLCRFYSSLIKLGLVDAGSDADSAAMAHFALAHAHFEDAHALYRVLVMGKF